MVYKYSDLVDILIYETRTEDKLETLCTCTGCRTSEPSNSSIICAFVLSMPASHTSIVGIGAIPTQTAFLLAISVKLPCASLLWGKSVTLKFTQVISTYIYICIYYFKMNIYIYIYFFIYSSIYLFIYIINKKIY